MCLLMTQLCQDSRYFVFSHQNFLSRCSSLFFCRDFHTKSEAVVLNWGAELHQGTLSLCQFSILLMFNLLQHLGVQLNINIADQGCNETNKNENHWSEVKITVVKIVGQTVQKSDFFKSVSRPNPIGGDVKFLYRVSKNVAIGKVFCSCSHQ